MARSILLMGPLGASRMFHTVATATMDVKYGKKHTVRRRRAPRILEFSKSATSSATISRVNHSLQYGANGYEIVFGRMEKKDGGEQNGEEEN